METRIGIPRPQQDASTLRGRQTIMLRARNRSFAASPAAAFAISGADSVKRVVRLNGQAIYMQTREAPKMWAFFAEVALYTYA
jgi:hypothetical protein